MQYEEFGSLQKLVTAAGTAVALGETQGIQAVTIKALATNVGDIYVGGQGVTSANGYVLDAGESVSIECKDIAFIYINADTNNDGVSALYKK